MASENISIQHVSDTALWVAYYRAVESERADSLFKDHFAKILIGERGKKIAASMKKTSRYVQWSVVIRTYIIDRAIQKLVKEGVDLVINLGAGLDTRPYRLAIPNTLRWVEIDYPHLIEEKQKLLKNEKPKIQLERIPLDLANRKSRQELFAKLGAESTKVLIITEGVLPYLSEEQVASLAEDLHAEKSFQFWIAEYFSAHVYRYFKKQQRMKLMKNAPFQFFPADWFDFFGRYGWKSREVNYLSETSLKLGRAIPMPWWSRILRVLITKKNQKRYQQQMGYTIFTRS